MEMQIETARLQLRVLDPRDANLTLAFYERNRQMLSEYENLEDEKIFTLKYMQQLLQVEFQEFSKLHMVRFWLFEKSDLSNPIGTVSYLNITPEQQQPVRVGYKMDESYWRRGYCFEALNASMEWLYHEVGIKKFEAIVQPDNDPSIQLLRKLGFRRMKDSETTVYIAQEWRDHELYQLEM